MPTERSIALADTETRIAAEKGSSALLYALLKYGVNNGGLPRISPAECWQRMLDA